EAISQLQLSFEKDGKERILTASFGIGTLSSNQDMTSETLFDLADKALFRAKKAGRNSWA
ncbi:MAG: diguanylate cyclase, partial [Glaciecola sp.]